MNMTRSIPSAPRRRSMPLVQATRALCQIQESLNLELEWEKKDPRQAVGRTHKPPDHHAGVFAASNHSTL